MKKVLSDQVVQFQSEKWERTLRENGIQPVPVSYTHLDVYKRQNERCDEFIESQKQSIEKMKEGRTCLLYTSRCV